MFFIENNSSYLFLFVFSSQNQRKYFTNQNKDFLQRKQQ